MQSDFGTPMSESTLKAGLRNLNPEIAFDLGDRHNLWHPSIERWQGVWWREKHLGTIDRGIIPEADVFLVDPKTYRVIRVWRVGWRTSLRALAKHGVPGLDWAGFSREFKVEQRDAIRPVFVPNPDSDPMTGMQADKVVGWR